ncbi:hypothetical protein K8I61_09570, partial [bacterium]|nr:hypothetical protein [bacterium]
EQLANKAITYLNATTNLNGVYAIEDLPENGGPWFVYVQPAADDVDRLPGGSASRASVTRDEIVGGHLSSTISMSTGEDAFYVGTSVCLSCHGLPRFKKTLHRRGIHAPYADPDAPEGGPLQDHDLARHPKFNDGLAAWADGVTLYYSAYDATRGTDKYETTFANPVIGVSFFLDLYQDVDDSYKVAMTNVKNPADPNNPTIWTVELVYGGGMERQQYLMRKDNPDGSASFYPLPFQFQPDGKETHADRTRKTYRDWHGDWYYDEANMLITEPVYANSFDANCASCHYNGFELDGSNADGWSARAVTDENGAYDLTGDGIPEEINIGCESCHGPGSNHWARAGQGWYIVTPQNLAAERESTICGSCHAAPRGKGLQNESPINLDYEMPIPGLSREEWLSEFVNIPGPAGNYWASTDKHSKMFHEQYTDHMRSGHYRNEFLLLSCSDCHETHGASTEMHELRKPVTDNELCIACHTEYATDDALATHTAVRVGTDHVANNANPRCVDCHMPQTGMAGAGKPGLGDYWENDRASHMMRVPDKDEIADVPPQLAMPVPYTKNCNICHTVPVVSP